MPVSDDQWRAARNAYELGENTVAQISDYLGVSHQMVSKRRIQDGWADHGSRLPVRPPDAQAVEQTWESRMSSEAAAAGLTAGVVRQRIFAEVRTGQERDAQGRPISRPIDASTLRALSYSYGILIDRAQLLTGNNTEQIGVATLDPADRAARVTQVLQAAAERRAQAIEATTSETL